MFDNRRTTRLGDGIGIRLGCKLCMYLSLHLSLRLCCLGLLDVRIDLRLNLSLCLRLRLSMSLCHLCLCLHHLLSIGHHSSSGHRRVRQPLLLLHEHLGTGGS